MSDHLAHRPVKKTLQNSGMLCNILGSMSKAFRGRHSGESMEMIETIVENGVATLRFDRGGKANALNAALISALKAAADALARREDVRAIVLSGTPRVFAAGVDLKDAALWDGGETAMGRAQAMAQGGAMVEAWRRLPQPVIAAIEGPAIGGGAILALAADFRVMAQSAYLRFPEVKLGMTLGWGGLALLVEGVGAARAKRILLDDETLSAEASLTLGLCDKTAADGAAVQTAQAWAVALATMPAMPVQMTKASIDAAARQNWAAASEMPEFFLARTQLETEMS